MAVEAVFGGETAWHSEFDGAASKVLEARWPGVPNWGDITKVDWRDVEPVDVLCGGFPCQDVSVAGLKRGMAEGTRSGLWSYFADAIDELHPRFVVIENVRGLLSGKATRGVESDDSTVDETARKRPVLRAAGAVLGDLADRGYDAEWATVSASDIGAPHKRERVFVVAYPAGCGWRSGSAEGSRGDSAVGASEVEEPDNDISDAGRVTLLPTPVVSDAKGSRNATCNRSNPDSKHNGGTTLTDAISLLPTPAAADGTGGRLRRSGARFDELLLTGILRAYTQGELVDDVPLLGTPAARDAKGAPSDGYNRGNICHTVMSLTRTNWGVYEPAVSRWESLTRLSPEPTIPGVRGNKLPRINPRFSEWMMGWPEGWVTDVEGIGRIDQLKIIGNGVVSQQAAFALQAMLCGY